MNSARRTGLSALVASMILLAATPAAAQLLSVKTALSEPVVAVGDVVNLQVTVTARVSGRIEVDLPEVDGLTELSRRQSQSQSLSWSSAGQQVLIEQVYAVDYRAHRPGKFTIGPVSARVGKRRAKSTPVTLRVRGEAAIAAEAEDATANEVAEPGPGERSLFLRYRVNRAKPYLGQAVLLDLEVISDPNQSFQVEETTGLPEVDAFWTQILEQPRRLRPRRVSIGGRSYVSYRIWRAALYPLNAGEHTLPPVSMRFSQGGGLFRTGRRFRRRTKPVKIEVKPLPSEGRPKGFVSTNVGQYDLSARVDQRRVPAGKALLYTVRLSGRGNISSAKLPTIERIPGFRVFAPTVRDDVKTDSRGVSGFKEAEYLLMPQKGGRLTIPAVQLSTFDPVAGKYRELESKALRVVVEGTPDPTTAPQPPPTARVEDDSTPTLLALRPLRFTSDLTSVSEPPWRQLWFWAALFLPAMASAGFAGYRASRQWTPASTPRSAQKAVTRQARAALEDARADVDNQALADAHAKIADALRTAGSMALDVSLQGLTLDAVTQYANDAGLSAEDARDLVRLLEAADYARYAPSQLTDAATRSDIYRAEQLVTTLTKMSGGDA